MGNGQGAVALEKRLGDTGIDPITIITIITAILQMLGKCPAPPTPTTVREASKKVFRVALAIRREDQSISLSDCFSHAAKTKAIALAATDDELQSLINDA